MGYCFLVNLWVSTNSCKFSSEHCDQARADVALSRHRAFPAPENGLVRSITTWGAAELPQDPKARREISALPLGTPIDQRACHSPLNPSTNRAPIGCRERFTAQPRPLFRQWMTTKEASLDAMYKGNRLPISSVL